MPLDVVCIQVFAVLWEENPDTRVIDLIEQSLIIAQLSPVKLLHDSEGELVIAYDSQLTDEAYNIFQTSWEGIASGVMYDSWSVLFIKDTEAGSGFNGGRLFRKYGRVILNSYKLGITDFTRDLFFVLG